MPHAIYRTLTPHAQRICEYVTAPEDEPMVVRCGRCQP
jgi:hypothetical protein